MGYADAIFVNNPPEAPVPVTNVVEAAALALIAAALSVAQGAAASSLGGLIVQGVVRESPAAYLTGEAHALPLSAIGAVRVSPVAPIDLPDLALEADAPANPFSGLLSFNEVTFG